MSSQAPSSTPLPPPNVVRAQFDEVYAEMFASHEERSEVEILTPIAPDIVRLFFELADEALLNPARDNPFSEEKKVYELSSESLAEELTRLQKLGEAALNSFGTNKPTQTVGQLPSMLATMYVGATQVRPASSFIRLRAALADGLMITLLTAVISLFITWFTAQGLRPGFFELDPTSYLATLGLFVALFLPLGVIYHLRPGRSLGYRLNYLEVVNLKTGNPAGTRINRLRAWLFALSIPTIFITIRGGRWLVDRVTGTTVRRNYALKAK